MSMKDLTPQLFLSMKQYTGKQFTADVISGIIVAIIALPLSIALALASGVTPVSYTHLRFWSSLRHMSMW